MNKDDALKEFEKLVISGDMPSLDKHRFVHDGVVISNPYEVDGLPEDYYGESYINWFEGLKTVFLDELEKMRNDSDYAAEHFNDLLTDTGLFVKYEELNKSYDKYKDDDGWSNALFHYFFYDSEDLRNWSEWMEMVIESERKRLFPDQSTLPKLG